jgi:hypothetical protein
MLMRKSPRAHPEARSAFFHRPRTVSVEHPPRQNRLLATLPEADYGRLLADLEPVPLLAGQILHVPNSAERHLYFIAAGLVVRYSDLKDGATIENAGLVHHTRGRIILLDRPRLEALVCECYAVVKREYARLLGPAEAFAN